MVIKPALGINKNLRHNLSYSITIPLCASSTGPVWTPIHFLIKPNKEWLQSTVESCIIAM